MVLKLKGLISLLIWNTFVNEIARSFLTPRILRFYLYKLCGMRIKSSNIRAGCIFRGKSIVIEKGAFLNHNVFIDGWETVIIKENAAIAFDVLICTSSHKVGETRNRAGVSDRKPVIIGKGCWIGARSTILPGVTLGDGCVIAAGSVVNRDCKPNTLYAGVPAKEVKSLFVGSKDIELVNFS